MSTLTWPNVQQAQNDRKAAFEAAQARINEAAAFSDGLRALQRVLFIREVGWENAVTITLNADGKVLDLSQDPVFVQEVEKSLDGAAARMKAALGLA